MNNRLRGRVTHRKSKRARDAAHRLVRADSCPSGLWSMPCDLLFAACSQHPRCFAAFPQRAGRVPSISGGEKIPRGGGRAVLRGPAETSKGRREGCKEAAQARARALRRLSVGRSHRVQRFRSLAFFAISSAVLRLWQLWHRLWRLPGSVNTAQSPLWSRMWSTSVALVLMPCLAHSRHHGSRKS